MTLYQALILGIVQGLTEFLPVSSSSHLVIVQNYFHLSGPILLIFDVVVHLGTLLAIFIYFAKTLLPIPKLSAKMWGLIIVANVPTAIIGFLLKRWMEDSFNLMSITTVTLLINSAILWSVKWAPKDSQKSQAGWLDAVWIGIAQGISILPGVSRSGATVTTALWLKIKSEEAVRFSFFIGIIPILGASLLYIPESLPNLSQDMWPVLLTGFAAAFVSGYTAIIILFKMVSRGKFHDFALYTLVLAVVCFFYFR